MSPSTVLGSRFTLLDEVDHDIPGIERHLAQDSRLGRRTVVDIVHSLDAATVRKEATRASRLRDPRLARIVTSGQEDVEGRSVTYVAIEQVPGASLDTVLARHRIDTPRAITIIAGAARALVVAKANGMAHGYVRPSCITVSPRGRVVVAGLGVDGLAATHAGLASDATEESDARALTDILIRALTGLDAGEATADDLPDDLPARAHALATDAMRGSGPATLRELVDALSGSDARALVDFASTVDELPLIPRLEREAQDRARREAEEAELRRAAAASIVTAETLVVAQRSVEEALATERSQPGIRQAVLAAAAAISAPDPALAPAADDARVETGENGRVGRPADRREASFDTLEIMVAEQNKVREPGTWELVLEALHRRWPASETIARSLRRARERAERGGPLNGSRVVMTLAIAGMIIAVMMAMGLLKSPLDPSIVIERDPDTVTTPGGSIWESPAPDADE